MSTVLITGANRGIGLEFATQFTRDGWRVIACCRQPGQAKSLNHLAKQHKHQLSIFQLDVTAFEEIDQLSKILRDDSIDILINNAGIYPPTQSGEFGHINYSEWIEVLKINTLAPLKMAEAFVEQIGRSQLRIIATITSKMGSISDNQRGGSYLYRSSKAAANMVIKSLAIDLQSRGIISILLHPGWVQTDMGGPSALISPKQSVSGMRKILSQASQSDSGGFFAYDGKSVPW
jgi:NAD(P)-dependent dehydrogenase (short-subunit alcohol dehydrogenase family)